MSRVKKLQLLDLVVNLGPDDNLVLKGLDRIAPGMALTTLAMPGGTMRIWLKNSGKGIVNLMESTASVGCQAETSI